MILITTQKYGFKHLPFHMHIYSCELWHAHEPFEMYVCTCYNHTSHATHVKRAILQILQIVVYTVSIHIARPGICSFV